MGCAVGKSGIDRIRLGIENLRTSDNKLLL